MSSTILTYSGYILGCLWLYSADYKGVKSIDRGTCIMAAGIKTTCIKDTCISSTYAISTWIGYTNIRGIYTGDIYIKSTFVQDFKLRALIGSRVNDCYLWLFIGLIFAFITKRVCC